MKRFRFGVVATTHADPRRWLDTCVLAEDLGYDVLLVPDHLGMEAPLSALAAAAVRTGRIALGTFVLNAAFWNPVLLARELATVDRLSGGRLEVGLGAGYSRAEFDEAGIPWSDAATRTAHLEKTVRTIRELLAEQGAGPPVLVGGTGDRVLSLAARHADIVGLTPGVRRSATGPGPRLFHADELEERLGFLAAEAGAAGRMPELNLLVHQVVVTADRAAALAAAHEQTPHLSVAELAELPSVLTGTVEEIADALVRHRDRFGISYLTVRESAMAEFAPVVAELGRR